MYVPILKSKKGEMDAIKHTYDDILDKIVPLVEILPEFAAKETSVYVRLKESWRGDEMFVDASRCDDASHCGEGNLKVLQQIQKELDDKLRIIPVVQVSDSNNTVNEAQKIASTSQRGICLRVNIDDLKAPAKIDQFIASTKLSRKQVLLLVDFGFVDNENHYQRLIAATNSIAHLNDYIALIVSAGSAPENLTEFKPDEDKYIERFDWQYWKKYHTTLSRKAIFSDYTTQHPRRLPPVKHRGSKSIQYTIENRICVLRGKRDDPSEAYLAHSNVLCTLLTNYFVGADYSYGDNYIKERSDIYSSGRKDSTGSPTCWVTARVNHHIAFVVKNDLAAIP